jgi:hypothetical protein
MRDPNMLLRQALIPLLSVVAGIGVLAILIYWIRVWVRDNEDSAGSTLELLSEYRELNRRGELTDEEYRIIKSRMVPQIGKTATVTGAGTPTPSREQILPSDAVRPSDKARPEITDQTNDAVPPGHLDEGQAG